MIHPSRRSCSGAVATISSMKAAGITTAPSSSVTIQSSGKIATPPQPIGSPQPTKVRPATEGGAAAAWHHTGNPVARTPATSRITASVTSAATPFRRMRADRMSPRIPASVTPRASATAIEPAGIASIAERVEMGFDHDSGVARSSRAGTKRSVNARPTRRGCPGLSGRVPRIQTLRRPFFSRSVVRVAVVTRESAATTSWSLPIAASVAGERAILRVRRLALEVDLAQQRRELRVVHGLHQVMIEAGRAGAPHILVLAPAGHRHQRHGAAPRLRADRARGVVAVEPRHADVEERYVGLELAAEREALHAVGRGAHVVAEKQQHARHAVEGVLVVVGHHHAAARRWRLRIGLRRWQAPRRDDR